MQTYIFTMQHMNTRSHDHRAGTSDHSPYGMLGAACIEHTVNRHINHRLTECYGFIFFTVYTSVTLWPCVVFLTQPILLNTHLNEFHQSRKILFKEHKEWPSRVA